MNYAGYSANISDLWSFFLIFTIIRAGRRIEKEKIIQIPG